MPKITKTTPRTNHQRCEIPGSLNLEKCIIITGAGVSCAAGVPDFRSLPHLRSLWTRRNVFDDEFRESITEFRSLVSRSTPTEVHRFVGELKRTGRLIRCYTQNVDSLEEGILKMVDTTDKCSTGDVIQLHGSIRRLRCDLCHARYGFADRYRDMYEMGERITCRECSERSHRFPRSCHAKGYLRPDVILYDEPHPNAETIAAFQMRDMRSGPKTLLVMGTSLRIAGVRRYVKGLAKVVRANGGISMFVNLESPGAEMEKFFDAIFTCDVDRWVAGVTARVK